MQATRVLTLEANRRDVSQQDAAVRIQRIFRGWRARHVLGLSSIANVSTPLTSCKLKKLMSWLSRCLIGEETCESGLSTQQNY